MRICHAIFSSPWAEYSGGGQFAVHRIAQAMGDRGHDVDVIYSDRPDRPAPPTPYRSHIATHCSVGSWNLDAFEHGWILRRLLNDGGKRFDVVYGHSVNSLLFGPFCRRAGVPFVYVFHGRWLPEPGIRPAGRARRTLEYLRRLDYHLVCRALRAADDVVVFSEWSRSLVTSASDRPAERIFATRLGIEREWFGVVRDVGPGLELLHWGRLAKLKGIEDLLRAFADVLRHVPEARLSIAGAGALAAELQQLARSLRIERRVRWLGKREPQEIREACRRAHLAVFPTHVESFGLSIAEARAARVPVIATDGGAVSELVRPGRTGTLVPVRNPGAMAAAILAYRADPEPFESMAVRPDPELEAATWNRLAEILERRVLVGLDQTPTERAAC